MPPHITRTEDLVTSHEATRNGFLAQALTKTGKAKPYAVEARQLLATLEVVPTIDHLPRMLEIRGNLIAAAGFSQKAQRHLTEPELRQALLDALRAVTASAGDDWREEIVYRFLLTRGDTLGGVMRNITGALGGKQLTAALAASLQRRGIQYHVDTANDEGGKVRAIRWGNRLLVFDKKSQFVGNSIDAILCSGPTAGFKLRDHGAYMACGELKGGIDPAGADEHWKTARAALDRIQKRFTDATLPVPLLFFVGAAIETAMAKEIFTHLQKGELAFAANLTVPQQVADLADWLTSL